MRKLDGKVAFVTGAARGAGRAITVRLAEEGADIIGIDIGRQIENVIYPLSTPEDLDETRNLVEKLGRRMVTSLVDVRDHLALREAAADGFRQLGRLDIVVANAGIFRWDNPGHDEHQAFIDTIDVNLTGVWNTVDACLEHMVAQGQGGAIVLISSTAGLKGSVAGSGGGTLAYAAAKHGVVGLMRTWANLLAYRDIRVNTIHPTGMDTQMVVGFAERSAAQAEREPEGSPLRAPRNGNLMPIGLIDPREVANAIAWLVSDEARYVTGVTLPVDAGFNVQ